jgi:hypothetical protein
MSIFCTECGSQFEIDSKFCAKCGKKLVPVETSSESPLTSQHVTSDALSIPEPTETKNNPWNWIVAGIAGVVGATALQSALSMSSQAEYVTFDFSFETVMNGGWYTWYSGLPAMAMKLQGSGMDAGYLRMILWAITGFSLSLIWPLVKASINKKS